jgi:peptidoglycan biosynthesis protein MviN/MurJ (putative lipid II flippase)
VATFNFLLLYALMRRAIGDLETGELFATLAKLALPSALLGGVCWLASHTILTDWANLPLWQQAARLAATIIGGGGVFFGGALLCRIGELDELTAFAKRKLARLTKR